ncbi:unnamed protein product [Rotaria sp. Silwood1]|nr:unnamed protein product [Rotaria sp. Silwood1]CAF1081007.1 unnamed protein product [Rotaria sp. Silwood1]CAF3412678.1 unnamed protein product [Rotaria sp. Silwood1]CAF3437383.1 unnamed protein product [Rotaria sp. Silwood1]CAF3438521.1 unnamed protein product [Rotaria sp. Silwood1]
MYNYTNSHTSSIFSGYVILFHFSHLTLINSCTTRVYGNFQCLDKNHLCVTHCRTTLPLVQESGFNTELCFNIFVVSCVVSGVCLSFVVGSEA